MLQLLKRVVTMLLRDPATNQLTISYLRVMLDRYEAKAAVEEATANVEHEVDGRERVSLRWLFETHLQLPEYIERFVEHGFEQDLESLREVTSEDLRGIGVVKLAHRKRILRAVREFL